MRKIKIKKTTLSDTTRGVTVVDDVSNPVEMHMCVSVWVRIPKTLQSVGNECPERSLLHLTDPVIAFPPLHLSSSARPVMLAELNWAEVDREGCSRTARRRRWRRVCLDVAEVSVHCLRRWDGGEEGGWGERGGEDRGSGAERAVM